MEYNQFMTNKEILLAEALSVLNPRDLSEDASCASVAAALVTDKGNIYRGVCIDVPCSLGFCAEHSAIASMLTAGESRIAAIIAVTENERILPPCGRCRELMYQVNHENMDTVVFLSEGSRTLKELLPEVWN